MITSSILKGCEALNDGGKVAEGGVLLALYSILLFLVIQLPFIGSILFFILPIPFILIALKQSMTFWVLNHCMFTNYDLWDRLGTTGSVINRDVRDYNWLSIAEKLLNH